MGCLGEEPKGRKRRGQGGLGGNKHEKIEQKGDKEAG